MQDLPVPDLDALADRVAAACADPDAVSSDAARFLLRQYLASGRDDLREPLGAALGHALAHAAGDATITGRAAWLTLFVEAIGVADDERVGSAAHGLARALRGAWPVADGLRDGMASVDACLRAAAVVDPRTIVQPAIDELERIVGSRYQPGDGLLDLETGAPCPVADHVRTAAALLTAFEVTGRLPYSMLAEELVQTGGRRAVDDDDFVTPCETARVLCRLATLHGDAAYRSAAVLAPGADYRRDAARLLDRQTSRAAAAATAEAALFGVAMREFLSLR